MMRPIVAFLVVICFNNINSQAQDASVEQSIFGIQSGFIGVFLYNESKLNDEIVWRNEIGLGGGIFGGSFYDKVGFVLTPEFSTETRWYYNLKKRINKSKKIEGNSGNFASIKAIYFPDWFVISNYENLDVISRISIGPTWGIRRQVGKHFHYETGFAIIYWYEFSKSIGYPENYDGVYPHITLRAGYSF